MYRKIMVPVDLAHLPALDKAMTTAGQLAKLYDIPVVYVGVTAETPGSSGHNPAEYAINLEAHARAQAELHSIRTEALALASHDPTVDLDKVLLGAIDQTDADLVLMASHKPGWVEYLFSSNAGYIANHATVSVFVVR